MILKIVFWDLDFLGSSQNFEVWLYATKQSCERTSSSSKAQLIFAWHIRNCYSNSIAHYPNPRFLAVKLFFDPMCINCNLEIWKCIGLHGFLGNCQFHGFHDFFWISLILWVSWNFFDFKKVSYIFWIS